MPFDEIFFHFLFSKNRSFAHLFGNFSVQLIGTIWFQLLARLTMTLSDLLHDFVVIVDHEQKQSVVVVALLAVVISQFSSCKLFLDGQTNTTPWESTNSRPFNGMCVQSFPGKNKPFNRIVTMTNRQDKTVEINSKFKNILQRQSLNIRLVPTKIFPFYKIYISTHPFRLTMYTLFVTFFCLVVFTRLLGL